MLDRISAASAGWADLILPIVAHAEECVPRDTSATRAYEDLKWAAGAEDNERNWLIEADLRAKEARRLEQERLRVKALEKQAVSWNKSQLLTAYLSAVRATAQKQLVDTQRDERFDEWLSWAEAYAASLDPLRAQPQQLSVDAAVKPL